MLKSIEKGQYKVVIFTSRIFLQICSFEIKNMIVKCDFEGALIFEVCITQLS